MSTFEPGRLLLVTLWAEDVPSTAHFYRDVMGLPILPHHGHQPTFKLGEGLHLVIGQGPPRPLPPRERAHWPDVAFVVDDLNGAVEHLKAHGVEIPCGIETGPEARWVLFSDPAGNLIEYAELRTTGQQERGD